MYNPEWYTAYTTEWYNKCGESIALYIVSGWKNAGEKIGTISRNSEQVYVRQETTLTSFYLQMPWISDLFVSHVDMF